MQNKLYFCTNTKMSKGLTESLSYLKDLQTLLSDLPQKDIELAVMLPFTALYPARQICLKSNILLGAQNVCQETDFSFTGEISAPMLKELNLDCVMIGHSERRRKAGETDSMINQKVLFALSENLTVFLGISETASEKQYMISDEVLRIQLKRSLYGIRTEQVPLLRILYEPAWAIGKDSSCIPPDYVGKKHNTIRSCLCELFGSDTGSSIPVIYGGSVSPSNACRLIDQPNVDGLGIGRSAWDAFTFNCLIRNVQEHVNQSTSKGDKPYAENFK